MKKKNILILLGVLAVLVLAAILIEGMGKRDEKKVDEESILFPGFAADQVSSIEIKTEDKEVKLNKEGETWLVATADNYPADQEAVEKILDTMTDLKSTLTASRSAEKHSQFEVDEESSVVVTMLGSDSEDALARIFIGKMGPDFMSTYIRKADQDAVLLADGYLRGTFDRGPRGWRDRTIFDFDTTQVQSLTLTSQEKGEISIEAQEDGSWQIIEPEVSPGEKDAVDGIISDISKLSADDFAEKKEPTDEDTDPLSEYKLDEPQSKVTIELKDGSVRILHVGDISGQRYYVKREGKDAVFILSKSKIDRIFKGLEDLKAEPAEEQETDEVKTE
ncbi:DUF4340 domain-containing protein [Candidatus Poribacteria bacterium]